MASERIVSADEARALREKWHRYDGPYEVSPDDTGDLVIHYEDTIVARIEDFDEHSEPLARLFASAPDDVKMLARTVEVLLAAVSDLRTDNARLDDVAKSALDDLARVRAELDAMRAALDRAHHAVREHGPRCSHPECDALAPLRCDDCGRRFCDEHDDGLAGHDPGFGPQAHAVGPDDLMAGAAMRAAEASR